MILWKMAKSKLERKQDHQESLLKGLLQLYQDRTLTDVTLTVDKRTFPCNRNVLAASSPYFRAMFTSNVQETSQENIALYDVTADAVECILNFMYSGVIDIGPDNAQDIFMASNMFELLDVVDCCVEYMNGQLHCSNCVEMYRFAHYHHCKALQDACKHFIMQHFTDVSTTDQFFEIDTNSLEEILQSDDIYVKTEDFIFKVICDWVKFDVGSRKSIFPRLFHLVRLPLVTQQFFNDCIINNELVQENPFCQSIIEEFLHSAYNTSSDLQIQSKHSGAYKTKQRSGMLCRDLIVFSGGANGEHERSFTAYDPETRKNYFGLKHHPTFDLKYRIDYFKIVTVQENETYFIGGIFHDNYRFSESGEAMRNVYKYDQRLSVWTACDNLITARCAFSACCHGHCLFVSGGKAVYPTGYPLDSFEMYDVELGYWKLLEPMPLKLYHHASAIANDGVYIFGGKDVLDEFSDMVMRYDIKTETWYIIDTKLVNPRCEHSAITMNNEIYLIGGVTRSSYAVVIQIFDVNTNRWRHGTDFPDDRKVTAVTLIGNKIYVCGGIRQFIRRNKPTRTVESKDLYSYNVITDAWWKESRMVQYANSVTCTYANINTSFLTESDFVSVGSDA
ncbi:kelch-like protein 38 isoform X1 [Mytilus trossulus]|uniref:kelch-like protein 38 isoform X1 n=2 Tax=Mytilus trossulus TaxID=6551 RepID=UPI0030058D66